MIDDLFMNSLVRCLGKANHVNTEVIWVVHKTVLVSILVVCTRRHVGKNRLALQVQ